MAKKKTCGIVMPISECDGLGASHWGDVRKIVESVASEAGFETRLVSDTFESNLIHKEILQNIYNDDLIICDVSGRNPNVFFELGIRMATQQPTIIIKDEVTSYPFDTGPNRYIQYPRDMRHPVMEKFKKDLSASIDKTSKQSKENSFIGQLGPFHIPDVESASVPAAELILERLEKIERQMVNTPARSKNELASFYRPVSTVETIQPNEHTTVVILNGHSERKAKIAEELVKEFLTSSQKEVSITLARAGTGEYHIEISGKGMGQTNIAAEIRIYLDAMLS
ncbi:hypothetical protein [Aliiroseovarius crassostreae]|uniref:hypothetical protein n=1 Tax=Aliiroseovarius crassostreae TaxID=154981 RepID=UPI0022076E78|nr:hypothetical protein [Aliiroseovarius crassostreae]UWQ03702.1 hypothetical protein K3X22_08205 [Aliiroseovarius crassostreae]